MGRYVVGNARKIWRPVALCVIAVVPLVVTLSSGRLWAQSLSEEVHLVPLAPFKRPADVLPALKANVDIALVNVTVTDPDGRIVTDLSAGDFSVLDDKQLQHIKYFSSEETPLSLAVVLDTSSSMNESFDEVRKAALEFFQASNPKDEFALISFADQPRIVSDFTDTVTEIEPLLTPLRAGGHTAVWDALYLGIKLMHSAHYPTKALVVISDGGDNRSRYTQSELKSVLREADVQVYAIDLFKAYPKTAEEKSGLLWLDELTTASGGRLFLIHNPAELHRAVAQIGLELHSQYVLGYSLPQTDRDGKWHKVKVSVNAASKRRLRVYAKKGYYGPAEQGNGKP